MAATWADKKAFHEAGYADIITNSSYIGGAVRQYGRLSFSRVYDAPHAVAAGQVETVSRIFDRAMLHRDVATGHVNIDTDDCYSTRGPQSSWCRNLVPEPEENTCYLYTAGSVCTPKQQAALLDGSAVTKDFVVTSPKGMKVKNLKIVEEPKNLCRTQV